jgi:uncharacterized damage-inducible protein DinB
MNGTLKKATFTIIDQLIHFLQQIPEDIYTAPLPILSGNTIGKHVRHIIEFYQCIFSHTAMGVINYDNRCRNIQLETNTWLCIEKLQQISNCLELQQEDRKMQMQMCLSADKDYVITETSLSRELIYNIEHATHHMAIIRIAVKTLDCAIELPQHFGIAFSTIQHELSKASAYSCK